MKNKNDKQEWILDYLEKRKNTLYNKVDVLDKYFVEKYIQEFNPKNVTYHFYGAPTCKEIGRLLSKMYKSNLLKRYIIGLKRMESGFPKWIYVYELR